MFTQVQKYAPKTAFDCPLEARDWELRCQGQPARVILDSLSWSIPPFLEGGPCSLKV